MTDSENRDAAPEPTEIPQTIEGERGIPSVNRIRSMQSRVTTVLAVGFASLVGIGLLTWYYSHVWEGGKPAAAQTQRERAQNDVKLPPLGRVHLPQRKPATNLLKKPASGLWGAPPPLPLENEVPPKLARLQDRPAYATPPRSVTPASVNPPLDRRLAGPVSSAVADSFASASDRSEKRRSGESVRAMPIANEGLPERNAGPTALAQALEPTATPAVAARVLPTQRLLLPKGSFVDCTLETAIDSSLPGLVTCITAADVFGADGTTVLLERGTKLTGETQSEARRGLARVFVLWTEARTPTGVVAQLDSPGTDELGRSGLPGHVQRHFFERFGAAMLVSVIEAAIDRAARPKGGGNVTINPSATEQIATEVLKSTINIPNTIVKPQGDRIQVLVARDVDFRSVYDLRPAAVAR